MVWDIMLCERAMLVDDEVPMLRHLLLVDPLDESPAKLGEHGMVSIPRLEIHRDPRPDLGHPQRAHTLEQQAAQSEHGASTPQPLVVLVDVLQKEKIGQQGPDPVSTS